MGNQKKILCTGSAGFILGNFVRKIIYEKTPYEICSIDKLDTNAKNATYINKNHDFHIADIRDQHIVDRIFEFECPNIVIHGAALTAVDASISSPNEFITSNVLGTQVIINSCVKYGVEKLLYISTDEVNATLENNNDPPVKEDAPYNTRSPYSASKCAGELLVLAANKSFGLQYNISRSCNIFGARQTTDKLIPKVIKCILTDQKIPVFGQGLQMREWLYVNDVCDAFMTIIESGKINEIYNISANAEITNIELVQKICNIMGKGHNLIDFIKDPRPGHDFRYSIDASKIKEIGWQPKVKFLDGLRQCVEWYDINRWIFKGK
jgi:dTDP-glucose 4,6-dehydratase